MTQTQHIECRWHRPSIKSMLTGVAPKRSTFVCCSACCAVALSPPCCDCCCGCWCCMLRRSRDGLAAGSWKKSLLSVFLRDGCDGGVAFRRPLASLAKGSSVAGGEVVEEAGAGGACKNGLPGDEDAMPPARAGTSGVSVRPETLPFAWAGGDRELVGACR